MGLPPSHPEYEQPWDEYLEAPVEEGEQHPQPMDSHLRDRMLERLDHERAMREGEDPEERYGWERERSLHDAKGSYRELRRALRRMRVQWPPGHRQVSRVYFWGLSFQLSFDDGFLLEAAELWLVHEIRGAVRVPPWLAEHEAVRKQQSVAELASAGMGAGQIARLLKIPKQKVRRLLAVSEADASVPVGLQVQARSPGEPERVRV